jgi:phosphatidylglycerophosphate synthase
VNASADRLASLAFLAFLALVAALYMGRIVIHGRRNFARVDKTGGTALLGKRVMEGGYWVLEPLGTACVRLGITPNMVSWASLVLGGVSGVLIVLGHFGFAAIVGAVSALLDTVDGMVARATGNFSDAGEVLDATVDLYTQAFMLGALTLFYRDVPVVALLVLAAFTGSFMVTYASAKAEAMQASIPSGVMRRHERAVYLLLGLGFAPLTPGIDDALHLAGIGTSMVAALVLIAALSNASAIYRMRALAAVMRAREAAA